MVSWTSVAVGTVFLYLLKMYYKCKSTPHKLYYVPTEDNKKLLSKCQILYEEPNYNKYPDGAVSTTAKYSPPFWLMSVHLHTIWASLVRKFLNLPFKRELLTTEDGGTISLDWFDDVKGKSYTPETPTIIILHGLTGGSYESYIQHFARHAMNKGGLRTVVINYRGCANTKVTSKRTYCAANTEDFRLGIAHVQSKIPKAPLFAAGFSLGSIILVKYLSEVGDKSPFVAAASLSNPMDLSTSAVNLKKSMISNSLYNRRLADNLKRMFNQWLEYWEGSTDIDMANVMMSQSILEVDTRLTAKVWGYKDVEAYYADAAPLNNIHKVKTKLLCVNCIDDPLTHVHGIIPQFLKNPNTILALLEWGGHLGFLEGWGYSAPSWSDRAVVEFFLNLMP